MPIVGSYSTDFYADRHDASLYSARVILDQVTDILPPLASAVDMGCGVGTWLSVLVDKGVEDVCGLDGPWVDTSLLRIAPERYTTTDLEEPVRFDRRYDLAISLEVAEHLSPASAPTFVASLVAASDFDLFSAAIPYQGGSHHVNEQWPEYWAELFDVHGYDAVDCIRSSIWTDSAIPTWYRQNTLLYVQRERLVDLALENAGAPFPTLSVVNPDSFVNKLSTVKVSWRSFRHALKRWFAIRIGTSNDTPPGDTPRDLI